MTYLAHHHRDHHEDRSNEKKEDKKAGLRSLTADLSGLMSPFQDDKGQKSERRTRLGPGLQTRVELLRRLIRKKNWTTKQIMWLQSLIQVFHQCHLPILRIRQVSMLYSLFGYFFQLLSVIRSINFPISCTLAYGMCKQKVHAPEDSRSTGGISVSAQPLNGRKFNNGLAA